MKQKRFKERKMVSLGGIAEENLPYPFVHFPNHYGTFFAFSKNIDSKPFFCECAKPGIQNYIKLRQILVMNRNSNPLRSAPFDSWFFPTFVSNISVQNPEDPISLFKFEKELCHRCNLTPPTMTYCHRMYGGQFIQSYGWYVNQAYLRCGINPQTFDFLPMVCPVEYQVELESIKKLKMKLQEENDRLNKMLYGPKRDDITDNEITYWRNVKVIEAQPMIKLRRETARAERSFTKKIENTVRQEFGISKVGEGWISETLLYQIIKKIYSDKEVIFHSRPEWLEGLELDIFIPDLNLAFEYQGQQHYHAIKAWGGELALQKLKERDKYKVKLCKKNKTKLIIIKYTEPLSENYVLSLTKTKES